MIRALYTSAQAMNTQIQSMDVIANNIANVNTTGFRTSTVVTQSFPQLLMQSMNMSVGEAPFRDRTIGGMTLGTTISDVSVNFTNGAFEMTAGELDLAIQGDGFFTVEAIGRNGEAITMFTRAGSFAISSDNFLVNQSGYRILDDSGNAIQIPNGTIEISPSGVVTVNSTNIATLGITAFEDNSLLRQHGYTLFTALDGAVQVPFAGQVYQGHLERSNVNIIREMVNMVNVSRKYEINSRLIGMHDTTLGQAVNEIARN
ncbi:MAG: flagellar hook-basal body protein [Defluviitaleaceae bacterium]|nr:flagellar hook-basal body protein [Defluviitaleaceae bacterium]